MLSLADELENADRVTSIEKLTLEKALFHGADLSHPLRPFVHHLEWSRRMCDEFFAQGDREKELGFEPMSLYDRQKAPPIPKAQLGFLNFVILPYWKCLFQVLGEESSAPLANCLRSNVLAWEARALEAEEPEAEVAPKTTDFKSEEGIISEDVPQTAS